MLPFLQASVKAQFVPAFLRIAFCLSFLTFSNLSVKVATFSQRHTPIFPQDKHPCQNNKQKFWNCYKINPVLKQKVFDMGFSNWRPGAICLDITGWQPEPCSDILCLPGIEGGNRGQLWFIRSALWTARIKYPLKLSEELYRRSSRVNAAATSTLAGMAVHKEQLSGVQWLMLRTPLPLPTYIWGHLLEIGLVSELETHQWYVHTQSAPLPLVLCGSRPVQTALHREPKHRILGANRRRWASKAQCWCPPKSQSRDARVDCQPFCTI